MDLSYFKKIPVNESCDNLDHMFEIPSREKANIQSPRPPDSKLNDTLINKNFDIDDIPITSFTFLVTMILFTFSEKILLNTLSILGI